MQTYMLCLVGGLLLLGVVGVLLYTLLSAPEEQTGETLRPFALLPVPDAEPSTQAFLQHLASQIAWMDAEILHCVLLVYPPGQQDIRELCEDMARNYSFFTACSLPEMHQILDTRAGKKMEIC